jgi:putative ABC transport system permease protein
VVLTFVTVVASSIMVSGVNIVSAIRGTPEDETPEPRRGTSWKAVALGVPALIVTPLGLWLILRKGFGISWAWICAPAMILLGGLCILAAKGNGSDFLFSFGFSVLPLALAILAAHYRAPARLTWTLVGAFLAAFWLSPVNVGEKVLGREMSGDIEMFPLSGIMVVIAFTLIIVFNARLLTVLFQRSNGGRYRAPAALAILAVVLAATGVALGNRGDGVGQLCYLVAGLLALTAAASWAAARFPRFAPALKMGVAYPLSNRFRTGMTIAMFSLIIFSLTTFSAVDANFTAMIAGEESNGGWDIIATAKSNNDLGDVQRSLRELDAPEGDQIASTGRVTTYTGQQEVRQGSDDWSEYPVIAGDETFLLMKDAKLDARASIYPSDRAAIEAVRLLPDLALIDWYAKDADNGSGAYDFTVDAGIKDGSFEPFELEVRDPTTGVAKAVTVVGVLPMKIEQGLVAGVYVNPRTYEQVFGAPEFDRAYIRLDDGVDAKDAARGIESALSTQGLQADSIRALIDETNQQDKAFTRMFQAFMALGLFVGIAALGVIAFRSVVERRQQIGMLRAIGYQTGTVAFTFVLESSFVALMGILSGVVGGVIVSRNLFTTGQFSGEGIEFIIPWTEVLLFAVVSFAVSLVMTWLPSRSAAAVPVADALRYE